MKRESKKILFNMVKVFIGSYLAGYTLAYVPWGLKKLVLWTLIMSISFIGVNLVVKFIEVLKKKIKIRGEISMDGEAVQYEALEWLKNNKNISVFASNRFGETENAIEFVKRLYEAGAVKVRVIGVWDDTERIKEEGGPYAETLIVQLPEDEDKRSKIFDIYSNEIQEYSLNEGEEFDGGDKEILVFWWD